MAIKKICDIENIEEVFDEIMHNLSTLAEKWGGEAGCWLCGPIVRNVIGSDWYSAYAAKFEIENPNAISFGDIRWIVPDRFKNCPQDYTFPISEGKFTEYSSYDMSHDEACRMAALRVRNYLRAN